MKKVFLVCAMLFLCSCAGPRIVTLTEPFDENQAKELMKSGKNTIEGSAVFRQDNGGIQKCAGLPVILVPVTKYAQERANALYGDGDKREIVAGVRYPMFTGQYYNVTLSPDIHAYQHYYKETTCDIDGKFLFTNIADGDFFILSEITWLVPNAAHGTDTNGGVLLQKVNVKGGERKTVILSPRVRYSGEERIFYGYL